MRYAAKLAALAALLTLLVGCGVINKLKARDELNKGVRAYKAAQFDAAIDHFQRAIELDPNLLTARIYLATAYASQYIPGSPTDKNKEIAQAAIQAFEDVLRLDPNNVTALAYLASLYYGMGGAAKETQEVRDLFEKSKEFRRRLIELEPRNSEHYYSIGVLDWSLAYRRNLEVRRDLNLTPDRPLPPRQRRELADDVGSLVEEGLQMLRKALEINPKYLEAIAYMNLMLRQKADIVESTREREELLQAADDYFQRHQRLREEILQAPAATPSQ